MDFNEESDSECYKSNIVNNPNKSAERRLDVSGTVVHRIPFKLRFTPEQDVGRSSVSSVKPFGLASTLTPKFYTEKKNMLENEDEVNEICEKINKLFTQGPREKFKSPILESQSYGWYHDVDSFTQPRNDRRLYHSVKISPMVKDQIFILANDLKTNKIKR